MEIKFKAIAENQAFARNVVASFILPLNPNINELEDIKTAVSEAVTNSIIHGYEERQGIVKLICKIRDKEVFIEISDSGKGIENVEMAKQPLYTTKANLERSGMGFTIMESFMDDVEVESVLGLGTKITMRRKIKSNSQKEDIIVNDQPGDEAGLVVLQLLLVNVHHRVVVGKEQHLLARIQQRAHELAHIGGLRDARGLADLLGDAFLQHGPGGGGEGAVGSAAEIAFKIQGGKIRRIELRGKN